MSGGGRPLRFLAITLAGWTGARIVFLWTITGRPPDLLPALLPVAHGMVAAAPVRQLRSLGRADPTPSRAAAPPRIDVVSDARTASDRQTAALALAGLAGVGPSQRSGKAPPLLVSPATGAPVAATRSPPTRARSRWSGDAWLLVRGGAMRGAGFGAGELGGSQAGVRIAYALGRSRQVALVGRLDTPLRGKGREAALGVAWHPKHLPVQLVAEERMPLDGGTAAPALGAIAGLNPTPLVAGFRLEAYGQAGALDRGGVQGFADGAARATHPLTRIGGIDLDLGGGAWGGAQRGAARLDLGPTLGVGFKVGKLPARLTIDWRQRVAGGARPGSGVAVSLGTDF